MKKTVLTLLTLTGLSMGTASAQSCCTTAKEICKPKVCCPSTPNCCAADKASDRNIVSNNGENKNKKLIINQAITLNKEVGIVEHKKIKL